MEAKEYIKDDNYVIEVAGDINMYTANKLKIAIFNAFLSDKKRLIMNLEKTEYIDSSGIGILIVALKKVEKLDGEFYLCNVPEAVMKVLKLTQLHKVFKFCTKEDYKLE